MQQQGDPFLYALNRERAGGLGIAGERLKKALDALRAFDAENPDVPRDNPERAALEKFAVDRLFSYIVTREACGATHHDDALAHFGVPPEFLARIGAS